MNTEELQILELHVNCVCWLPGKI